MHDTNGSPIPGVGEENIVYLTRRHWASMIGTFFLILVIMLVPLLLVVIASTLGNQFFQNSIFLQIIPPLVAIYYLVMITFTFVEWVNFYYSLFVLTQDEIIDITQKGFFNRLITQISIIRVQDVSASVKGFLPTLFGYGDVIAESAGEKTQAYVIETIPRPMEVADKIVEIHDCQVRRERNSDNVSPFREDGVANGKSCAPAPLVEIRSAPPPPSYPMPPPPPQPTKNEIKKDDLSKKEEVIF